MNLVQEVRAIAAARRERKGKGLLVILCCAKRTDGVGVKHGVGRSSVAKVLAKHLGAEHFSTGGTFRRLAKEKGMDINAFRQYANTHPEVDEEFDKRAIAEINSLVAQKEIVVVDSDLMTYFMKPDVAILVDADDAVRARRVRKGKRAGDASFSSDEEALSYLNARSEIDYYGYKEHPAEWYKKIDVDDQSMFDGTVDNNGTLEKSVEQALMIIRNKLVR